MATNGDTRQIQLEWRWQMFNPNKKFARQLKLVARRDCKTLGKMFDVHCRKLILQNRKDIVLLKARIKELEKK